MNLKSNKAITLIALIITIIILLILAGVTINMAIGKNGLLRKATIATEEYQKAELKERININISSTYIKEKGKKPTLNKIIDGLIEEGITIEENCNREEGEIITKEGYIVYIVENTDGNYEVFVDSKVSEEKIRISYIISPLKKTSRATITIIAKEYSKGIKSIEFPNGEKKEYTGNNLRIQETYEVTENGTYKFKIEGNNSKKEEKEVVIGNIVEGIIAIQANTDDWTRSVDIEVIWPNDSEDLIKEVSIDGGINYAKYTGRITVNKNCIVKARVKLGEEVLKTATEEITNIDTLEPQKFDVAVEIGNDGLNVSGSTSDSVKTETSECSGISGYYFSINNGESWVSNNDKTQTTYQYGIEQIDNALNVKMKAVDLAGNETVASVKEISYKYTGNYQTFVAPRTGKYQLEVWGAGCYTAKGGYAKGYLNVEKNSKLYIYVGEEGQEPQSDIQGGRATFNGGGAGGNSAKWNGKQTSPGWSGGGATDIRTVNGNWDDEAGLMSRIIVAGGARWTFTENMETLQKMVRVVEAVFKAMKDT